MAKELEAGAGDELRVICPDCESVWSTLCLPAECPTCAALVTMRVLKREKK